MNPIDNDVFAEFRNFNNKKILNNVVKNQDLTKHSEVLHTEEHHNEHCHNHSKKINWTVLVSSLLGTAAGIITARKINHKQNSLLCLKSLTIGTASIVGSFIGGIFTDKKDNFWKKIKEANYQLLTNIILPMTGINGALAMVSKLNIKQPIVKALAKGTAIVAGMFAGMGFCMFISNKINNKLIKPEEKFERHMHSGDLLCHLEHTPTLLSKINIPFLNKIVPFIFVINGYNVGNKE